MLFLNNKSDCRVTVAFIGKQGICQERLSLWAECISQWNLVTTNQFYVIHHVQWWTYSPVSNEGLVSNMLMFYWIYQMKTVRIYSLKEIYGELAVYKIIKNCLVYSIEFVILWYNRAISKHIYFPTFFSQQSH